MNVISWELAGIAAAFVYPMMYLTLFAYWWNGKKTGDPSSFRVATFFGALGLGLLAAIIIVPWLVAAAALIGFVCFWMLPAPLEWPGFWLSATLVMLVPVILLRNRDYRDWVGEWVD